MLFNTVHQGAPLRAVAQEVLGFSMQVVVSNKVAKERNLSSTSTEAMLEGVKGLKIGGMNMGQTSAVVFQGMMKINGKPSDWVEPGNTGNSPASLAALQNDVVDGLIGGAPTGEVAEADSYGKLVWNSLSIEQFRALAYGIAIMNPTWAESHPQVAEATAAALDDAQKWILANPQQAVEQAKISFPSVPEDQLLNTIKETNFAPSARITEGSMKAAQNLSITFSLTTNTSAKISWPNPGRPNMPRAR